MNNDEIVLTINIRAVDILNELERRLGRNITEDEYAGLLKFIDYVKKTGKEGISYEELFVNGLINIYTKCTIRKPFLYRLLKKCRGIDK